MIRITYEVNIYNQNLFRFLKIFIYPNVVNAVRGTLTIASIIQTIGNYTWENIKIVSMLTYS